MASNTPVVHCICLSLLIRLCIANKFTGDDECERVRRPMHLLTDQELMLYVEGMQAIRSNGKFQIMADAHSQYTEVHRGSSFFFYHSYYVWEVETQIRTLGGRFDCFSLPYYDWTVDAGHERHPTVLHSVFGGDGDGENMHCIETPRDLWTTQRWPLHELCGAEEHVDQGCCLKRALMKNHSISSAATLAPILQRSDFLAFDGGILMEHQMVHWLFGNGDECESCHMATGYSMDDPIFLMLHGFTAYLRALWSACHGYDQIASEDLVDESDAYTASCIEDYDECGAILLDEPYYFGAMVTQQWSLASRMSVTPRKMWNFADWGVRYDHGTFLRNSGLRHSYGCDIRSVAQSEYFVRAADLETEKEKNSNGRNIEHSASFAHKETSEHEREDEKEKSEQEKGDQEIEMEELNELVHVAHKGSGLSKQSQMILVSSAAILASAAVLFACAYFLLRSNKNLENHYNLVAGSPTDLYGSMEQYTL